MFELQVARLESERSLFVGAGRFETPRVERKHQRHLRFICAGMWPRLQNHCANLNCFRRRSIKPLCGDSQLALKVTFLNVSY